MHVGLLNNSKFPSMDLPSCSNASDDQLNAFQIVRTCCDSFDSNGEPTSDFPHCLFMVGEWLMETTELMAQFVALYQEEYSEVGENVCYAVGYWIRNFPAHFDANTQLCKLVERLKKMAVEDNISTAAIDELDVSSIPSYAWLRNVSVRNPVSRHVSLCFEQWSPEDISTSMSHVDYKVLSRVTIPEVKKYVKVTKLNQTPVLERSIAVFNSLSSWVQCMILAKSTAKERADVITKFINVGKHLRRTYNYNTLMAVIGGVTHSNISRLSKTHAFLTPETKKELSVLTQLLSNSNNYANYRKALQEVGGRFKMPIMGIHLKDLIAWNGNGGMSFEKTRTISTRRLYQLAHLLSYFLGVNRMAHNFADPNMDLINTLKVSLDISYNENDIYDLSLKREPRTLLSFQAVAKPIVFADWASGVCQQPDPDTVTKHISAMVDAVFKHYDNDRDAYISQSEFEQIAGNFPFLDPFVTIDVDRDGQISKSEMINYFLNINKQSMEFRRGFKHNFHETTFLTPAICFHCNKLLWGLIRQGYKCKDCGLIAHECCKDVAVAECRRKRSGGGLASWLNSPRNPPSSTTSARQSAAKRGLFLNYKPKNRTVSTVSESPSPEPPQSTSVDSDAVSAAAGAIMGGCAAVVESATPTVNALRSSFHKFVRSSRKNRAISETAECYRRNPSPDGDADNLASLASEEVFEDDSSQCTEVSMPTQRTYERTPRRTSGMPQNGHTSQPTTRYAQSAPNTARGVCTSVNNGTVNGEVALKSAPRLHPVVMS